MKNLPRLVTLAFAAAISLVGAAAQAQDTITLRLANFASASGGMGRALDTYAKQLEERSGGRIKAEVFHGSSMGPAPKHYDLVRTGVADIAMFVTSYTPGRFTKTDLFALPNILANARTDADSTSTVQEVAEEALYPEYEGVRMLWLAALSQDRLFTTNAPVRTLEDIKGKRIRVTSKSGQAVLRAVGADPISIPAGEVAEGLQKNSLDGLHASRGTVWALKVGDLVDYQTPLLKIHLLVGLAINPTTYDNLPDDLKPLIDELGGPESATDFVKAYDEENPMVNEYVESIDLEAVEPDAALIEAVAKASEAYNDELLSELEAEHPDLRALYDRIRALDQARN